MENIKKAQAARKGKPSWNAGTAKGFLDQRGYRALKIGTRTVREHRVLMERHLKRKLQPWEHIHHRNGDRTDNRIRNLELITITEHNALHHLGSKRSDQTKRTIAIFAQMRQEILYLRREIRKLKAEGAK
jgi:hypothetical protein